MSPLAAAAIIVLCEALAFGTMLPVISYYCEQLGGSAKIVGLMFALVSGPRVLTNPIFGWLSDRLGRRPILMINTLGTLAGSIGWALSPNIFWFAISRATTGVFGAQAALAQAIAADVSTPEKRAASVGLLGAAFGIALTFGPLLGGVVGSRFSYAAVGWSAAALQLISLFVITFHLSETRPLAPAAETGAGGQVSAEVVTRLYRRPGVMHLLIVTLVFTLGMSIMIATLPLLNQHRYGFDVLQTGYSFAVFGIVGAAVQGGLVRHAVRRLGELPTAVVGLLLAAVGYEWLSQQPPLWGFWSSIVLMGFGTSLAVPCVTGMLSRRVGAREQGGLMGLNQSFTGIGRAAGNSLGTDLFARYGAAIPFVTAAGLTLLSVVMLAVPWRRSAAAAARAEPG